MHFNAGSDPHEGTVMGEDRRMLSEIETLRALVLNSKERTKTGRLRELLNEIERTKKAGISNRSVVEALNQHGLDLTLKTFESILHRIRAEKGGAHHSRARAVPDERVPSIFHRGSEQDTEGQTRQPRTISTPADLAAIRNMDIDLDEYGL